MKFNLLEKINICGFLFLEKMGESVGIQSDNKVITEQWKQARINQRNEKKQKSLEHMPFVYLYTAKICAY